MPQISPLVAGDPTELGSFRLSGRIGEGGQGIVYLGVNGQGERAAIKLLHVKFSGDQIARSRFARELKAAQRVASFCTARVIEADLDGDTPYIASEYIDGRPLREIVETDGPLTGTVLDRLAIGTATALTAIHHASIIHRDFKPDNVLIAADGPRVVDFGIARIIDSTGTITSRAIGTPAYMAPEQIAGDDIGPYTDVFSWGATIAFAATGKVAFEGKSIAVVLNRILNHEVDVTMMDEPLRSVVRSALAKNPADRPSADQILLRLLGQSSSAKGASTAVLTKGAEMANDDTTPFLRVSAKSITDRPGATGARATGTSGTAGATGAARAAGAAGAPSTSGSSAVPGTRTGSQTAQGGRSGAQPVSGTRSGTSAPQTGARAPRSGTSAAQPGAAAAPAGAQTPQSGAPAPQTGAQAPQTGVSHGGTPVPHGGASGPHAVPSAGLPTAPTAASGIQHPPTGPGHTGGVAPPDGGAVPYGVTGPAAPARRGRARLWIAVAAVLVLLAAAALALLANGWNPLAFGDQTGPTPPRKGPSGKTRYSSVVDKVAETGKIVIGVKGDLPGIGLQNGDSFQGFDVDVAKRIAAELGARQTTFVRVGRFDRASALAEGRVDLVVATYSIDDSDTQFAGPYYLAHQDVLVRKGDINDIGDLKGKAICAPNSPSVGAVQDRVPVKPVAASDYAACMDMLRTGRVDAVPGEDLILAGFAARENIRYKILGLKLSNERYAVGIKKGDVKTCKAVSGIIADMYAKGVIKQLLTSYFSKVDFDEELKVPAMETCK
ncbi:serine/threonine-protein kinase [Nonomuraea sp. NPDC049309]|uniref:serine/threonine-protein kinase n=1 Tax=Nonomuraea sp. NPDC049309 TaxID=3364350 RepID=UPI0037126B80